MDTNSLIDNYNNVAQCEYKGRNYLARDNGAILRLPKEGIRRSKWDNIWTFGTKDESCGYMIFTGNVRVHQVVCTAFHGPASEPNMVVDHIDTNRCNNRPENLRWVTRLENALNNPITRRRIILSCGSIENFINNPSLLRENPTDPNIRWMRTVSKEEATICLRNLERWAKEDSISTPNGVGLGEWVFNKSSDSFGETWDKDWYNRDNRTDYRIQNEMIEEENRLYFEKEYGLKDSLTPGAKQLEWKTPTEFLLCPIEPQERNLSSYLANLEKGKVFSRNQYRDGGVVLESGHNPEKDAIYVLTYMDGDIKPWALCEITFQDGFFIHKNCGSFFREDGGQKFYTLAMGKEWTEGEVFDEFC